MCDPGSLAIAATVISTAVTVMKAQSDANAAKSAARVATANAEINNRAAADATQVGSDTAAKARLAAKSANATLRAEVGGGGLIADSGTPLAIQEQNTGMGELNALTIQNNAGRQAYGYKVGAMNDTATAAADRQQARDAITNGLLSGASTLVTGASSYSSKFGVPEGQFPWQKFGYQRPASMGGGFYGTA